MKHEARGYRRIMFAVLMFLLLWLGTATGVEGQNSSIDGYVRSTSTSDPIVGAEITVYLQGNTTPLTTRNTDMDGYFNVSGLSSGTYDVHVEYQGYTSHSSEVYLEEGQTYSISVWLTPRKKADEGTMAYGGGAFFLCFQTLVLITIVMVLSIVMYSKIKRENLLKHAVRKRIFDYIEENPGKHYRAILNDLELPIGMLSYHINRLEKAQYIKSRQDGMFRRFYISGKKTDMRFLLSEIQESILNVIRENRGISQSKIAEKIGVSRKVVNYHINILDQAGLILVESHGRESACFLRNGGTPIA